MTKNIQDLSFEDALQQLEKIVLQLENGDVPLEQAIQYYERGAKLKAHCEHTLKAAVHKIEKIQINADGSTETVALDTDTPADTPSKEFPL